MRACLRDEIIGPGCTEHIAGNGRGEVREAISDLNHRLNLPLPTHQSRASLFLSADWHRGCPVCGISVLMYHFILGRTCVDNRCLHYTSSRPVALQSPRGKEESHDRCNLYTIDHNIVFCDSKGRYEVYMLRQNLWSSIESSLGVS